ncbi:leukocyte receptor cluster member 9 isoform X2 [Melanotaenia boesemani]|uniref:leukocyte receptor cluster member 9 isoform X2 n=1 Tax=Melanotaenia boesemani TaxID=1250792 RepID=UPI001C04FFAD|nr:leukocyte receptor cluster member 9 isoform X2 [Melanotaenia boesemani]
MIRNAEKLLKIVAESAATKEDGVKACQFFLMGKCRFGPKCRFSHNDPSLDDSGDVSSDVDDKQDGKKMEKQKKKKSSPNKAAKLKHEDEKGVDKKPRMRTADDVISRILWDSSVDASEFVVGYVDRFLGVLERPFCDFSWDTNPCDCDYSAELALPRHRIQYFTYRGHRVWDRHTRTDRVFGSTGQSLAPPFGGEEEVNENSTQDQEKQPDSRETAEDQPAAVSGQHEGETEDFTHNKNSHLEEDNEMIHTEDSTHSVAECEGNTSQTSLGARVAEEAANRLQTSTEQTLSFQKEESAVKENDEEENLEEWEESWEGNEDTQSYLGAQQLTQNPSASLKQEEGKRGGRPPKKRPTHFITFRANTPAILSCFQQLQEELTTLLPSSAPHWQPASKLHITLCLLVLPSPAEVAAAREILRQFAHLDRNPPVVVTFPVKLKHFNGRVLYLGPQPQLHLQQLNSGLQEAYRKEGWLHRSSYNPRYHLTLAKVVDTEGERIFGGVGYLKVGKGLNFGRLPVNTLHLCAMSSTRVDGFYDTVCTVSLR